jgi:hypothetical protein
VRNTCLGGKALSSRGRRPAMRAIALRHVQEGDAGAPIDCDVVQRRGADGALPCHCPDWTSCSSPSTYCARALLRDRRRVSRPYANAVGLCSPPEESAISFRGQSLTALRKSRGDGQVRTQAGHHSQIRWPTGTFASATRGDLGRIVRGPLCSLSRTALDLPSGLGGA